MHDMQDVPNLLAVARAGAGVNNIPIADYSEKGIVVFNTPGANANGVKDSAHPAYHALLHFLLIQHRLSVILLPAYILL